MGLIIEQGTLQQALYLSDSMRKDLSRMPLLVELLLSLT